MPLLAFFPVPSCLPPFRALPKSPLSRCSGLAKARAISAARRRPSAILRASEAPLLVTLPLPWQCETSVSRGMLTTSFETCTAVSIEFPTPYHIRCAVDMSVTCTATQYTTPGQWVWVKPWGDEDGNIAACPLPHAPDGRSTVDLCFRRAGAVAEAVEAGEMLEVSEVCGAGFDAGASEAVAGTSDVWAFAAAESVLALLPILESVKKDTRVSVAVCVGKAEVQDYEEMYEVESEDEVVDFSGACAELLKDWAGQTAERTIEVASVSEDDGFGFVVGALGSAPDGCVALVSCPWAELEKHLIESSSFSKETVFVNR